MKAMILILSLAILPSCSFLKSTGCALQTGAGHEIATFSVKAMGCPVSCQPMMEADIDSVLNKTNLCTTPAPVSGKVGGTFGALICPTLASVAAGVFANNVIPQTWVACGCNAQPAASGLGALLTAGCQQVPF